MDKGGRTELRSIVFVESNIPLPSLFVFYFVGIFLYSFYCLREEKDLEKSHRIYMLSAGANTFTILLSFLILFPGLKVKAG